MAAVTVVCTVHRERGACNEEALLKILLEVDADVVFLELRASDLPAFGNQMLEARAARAYAAQRTSELVCVDAFEMPSELRRDADALFDYVERASGEFVSLVQQMDVAPLRGYAAINCAEFEEVVRKHEDAMTAAARSSRSPVVMGWYARWMSQLRQRESAMVSNIYSFCESRPKCRGVFLIGVAHLSSLVQCIEASIHGYTQTIQWEVWNIPGRFAIGQHVA